MTRLIRLSVGCGLLIACGLAHGAESGSARDPELNFEHVWKAMDRTYAQFGLKHVDWDALYRVYRPQITAQTTDEELWDTLLTMLRHLNDEHVCLADGTRRICAGRSGELEGVDFSLDLVKSKYLRGGITPALEGKFTSGWLTEKIAYLHIGDFKDADRPTAQAIDAFLSACGGASAMIVDVRNNPGGNSRVANLVADRFADCKRHYMRVQTRYGPQHDDLVAAEFRQVEPDGPIQFTRPTVLLVNRRSASAADGFALAMRVLPHVTVVGDLTEGAFASQFPDRMPNGWVLWVAFKLATDHRGFCYDGLGVPPDLRIRNAPADIAAGTDRVLEFAQAFLERGAPAPQDESASLADLRTSSVEEYVRTVGAQNLEAALAQLNRARAAENDAHFFSADEALQRAGQYLEQEQYPEAIGLLRACREEWPQFASTYAMLARAYLGSGEIAAAEASLQESESVEAMLPWEPPQLERARGAVQKARRGSAADSIGQALAVGGIPAAERSFQKLLSRRDTGPVIDEHDFNRLGYHLLQERNFPAAIYVFEKNAQLHPESWNAHDSLGEALVQAGRKERAVESYRRSLELNPHNANGRKMLQQLEGAR